MSDWQEFKLGDVAEITSSKRIYYSEYVPAGVPFFRSKEIIERFNGQNTSTELFIKRERYNEIKNKFGVPQAGDILLTSVGTLGIPYVVRNEDEFYFKDGNLTWFRNYHLNDLYYRFLYFWIISSLGQQKLYNASIGSTQPALTIIGLKNIDILLPPLPEQRAIASVLSSLDDKIDLLHRQNKTLEGLAATLWRKMFIEDADENWEEQKLKDICTITRGSSPRPIISYITGGIVPWIKIADATASSSYFIDKTHEFITENGISKSVRVYPGDLILSNSATCGLPYFVGLEGCIHDGWLLFRNFTLVSKIFVFFFLKQLHRELNYIADGSVQNNLNTGLLKQYMFKLPPVGLIQEFDIFGDLIINRIRQNANQIRTLSTLRDSLLPKLMSGEVRVNL